MDNKEIRQLIERLQRVDQASDPFKAASNHREAARTLSLLLDEVNAAYDAFMGSTAKTGRSLEDRLLAYHAARKAREDA